MSKSALLRYLGDFRLKSFVILIQGNSKSNHLGAQGTFNLWLVSVSFGLTLTPKALTSSVPHVRVTPNPLHRESSILQTSSSPASPSTRDSYNVIDTAGGESSSLAYRTVH